MDHQAYIRQIPGADTAVLFLHGIAGMPNHFVTQIPLVDLVPESWSVYNVLLHGHGGSVEDFSRSSMARWKAQVREIFADICAAHERVVIVGHSMGTLFAMQMALERPEKVAFLFLLAVPLRPKLGLAAVNNSLRLALGRTREDRPGETAIRSACGVAPTAKLWKYIGWTPRFLELFWEIGITERRMQDLAVPGVVFQSGRDELVSRHSGRRLERIGALKLYSIGNSTHFYYAPEDRERVRQAFCQQMRCNFSNL